MCDFCEEWHREGACLVDGPLMVEAPEELVDSSLADGLASNGDIAAWFVLVGLPWILATLHDRRRRGAVGWVDSS